MDDDLPSKHSSGPCYVPNSSELETVEFRVSLTVPSEPSEGTVPSELGGGGGGASKLETQLHIKIPVETYISQTN